MNIIETVRIEYFKRILDGLAACESLDRFEVWINHALHYNSLYGEHWSCYAIGDAVTARYIMLAAESPLIQLDLPEGVVTQL